MVSMMHDHGRPMGRRHVPPAATGLEHASRTGRPPWAVRPDTGQMRLDLRPGRILQPMQCAIRQISQPYVPFQLIRNHEAAERCSSSLPGQPLVRARTSVPFRSDQICSRQHPGFRLAPGGADVVRERRTT